MWILHEKNVQVQAEELNKEGKCCFGRNKTEITEVDLETRSDLLIEIHFKKLIMVLNILKKKAY